LVNRENGVPNLFHTRQITFPVMFTVYHTLETQALDLVRLVSPSSAPTINGKLARPNGHLHPSAPTTPRRVSFDPVFQDSLRHQLAEENDEAHCLVGLDVRNVYGVPFEVSLVRSQGSSEFIMDCTNDAANLSEDDETSASRLVPPGATERYVDTK